MNQLTIKQKIIGVLLALVAILGGGVASNQLGSVGVADEYRIATSTMDNTVPNSTAICAAGQTFGGVLVTIAGVAGGNISLLDGTTTSAAHPDWATTTIVKLPTNLAVGFYPFDIRLKKGLVNDGLIGNLMGSTTIFCR